ncbi:MAG: Isoleucine--tRNA ligase [Turneriella sp.]|nr:Isoleucine--tRNA ligase [Turneriella sp.]
MSKEKEKNPWEHTICLPQTVYPMRADLAKRENEILSLWEKEDLFRSINAKRHSEGAPTFLLHDGPPYANGEFHLGHALNKILKDILNKYHLLRGYRVPYVPGWDCHGLPIELAALKQLSKKKDGSDRDPLRIRQACREYAAEYIKIQAADQTRFGVWWQNPWRDTGSQAHGGAEANQNPWRDTGSQAHGGAEANQNPWRDTGLLQEGHFESKDYYATMSPHYEASILKAFRDLYLKGLIYKGKKPVYWDITTQSAHAEAEIEYAEHESPSIYVKFPVVGKDALSVVIWTTTPWTLPANLAVCFNEKFEYTVAKTNAGNLIVAKELLPQIAELAGLEVIGREPLTIDALRNLHVRHPFLERDSKVVFGDHVTLDAGTGIVHTAPGHGQDDYNVGQKYNLGVLSPVDNRGKYTNEFAEMEGKSVFEANPLIIEKMRENGSLLYATSFKHQYPHSWRSHKPLIMRATPQWFMRIDPIREKALEEIKKVKWIPDWGESRFTAAVKTRPDWCLSRQRYWGVPIPAFQCKGCGHVHLDEASLNHVIEFVEKEGVEVWYEKSADELLPQNTKCSECGSAEFTKESDILDVWFDSGVSWYAVLKQNPELGYPADVYLEGSDQHRGWFQSSLWPALALTGEAPFKKVITHGYILDAVGRAMSKSLGNGMSPRTDIIDKFGADILRLWVSSEDYRTDNKIGQEMIGHLTDAYRKIRNTLRYLLGNTQDGSAASPLLDTAITQKLDKWVLAEAFELTKQVTDAYDKGEFHLVYQRVLQFCTVTLSNLYLDMVRDSLYCDASPSGQKDSKNALVIDALKRRNSTLRTLQILVETLTTLLAPILSFTAEETQRAFNKGKSVFENPWPNLSRFENKALLDEFEVLKKIRDEVNMAIEPMRKAGGIGSNVEVEVELPQNADAETLVRFLGVSSVKTGTQTLKVRKSDKPKCPRCWLHRDLKESSLCERCDAVAFK